MQRCDWCGSDPLYITYHDTEWGVPERDGRALFEKLALDGFQAGLSWLTILRKRNAFRTAFAGFDPDVIAHWGVPEVERLLGNAGIVRHRGKIEATIGNARAWQRLGGDTAFSAFLWHRVGNIAMQPARQVQADVPAQTPLSQQISRDLATAGFRFCGPTIVYAFMQAAGMVNDHLVTCPRHSALAGPHPAAGS